MADGGGALFGTSFHEVVCNETGVVCNETEVVCNETGVVCNETRVVCNETEVVCNETEVVCNETDLYVLICACSSQLSSAGISPAVQILDVNIKN